MELPVQVTFRGIEPSAAVEAKIRERAEKLDQYHPSIVGCRVVVEAPHRRHHQGRLFHVRIDLTVPGSEITVSREPVEHHSHEDVYVAIRDAFDAARRQLEDEHRMRRGRVKTHEEPAPARVVRLFPEQGYGFIATADGREIYFHEHSVLNEGFRRLQLGSEVRFVEEQGDHGPQASTVRPVG